MSDVVEPGSPEESDVREIRSAVDRASMLTRQLLAFARRQQYEPSEMHPNSLITGVEKLLRRLLGADIVLRSAGYTVLEAERGAAALEVLRSTAGATVQLLLTDVIMPEMSGQALAQHAAAVRPGIRVVYTSGNATRGTAGGPMPSPLIAKPFVAATLLRMAGAALDGDLAEVQCLMG